MNPKTGEKVYATRRRIKKDMELPLGLPYSQFLETLILSQKEVQTKLDS